MAPSATVVACLLVLAQAERNIYGCQPGQLLFNDQFSLHFLRWGLSLQGDGLQEWLAQHRGSGQMVHLRFALQKKSFFRCLVLNRLRMDMGQVMKLEKSCQVLQDVRQACQADSARCPYAKHFPQCLFHSGLGPTAGSGDPVFTATQAPTGGAVLSEWLQQGRSPNEIEDVVQQLFKALALLHSLNWVHGGLLDPESVWIAEGPVLWLTNLACHQKFRGRDSQLDLSCAPAQLRPPRPPQPEPNLRKQFFGYDLWCAGELLKWMLENNKGTTGMFSFFRKVRQTKVRDIKAIASGLLQHQPSNRTTAAEVLEEHFDVELPRGMKQPMEKVAQ